jgi:hypothetical protein
MEGRWEVIGDDVAGRDRPAVVPASGYGYALHVLPGEVISWDFQLTRTIQILTKARALGRP